LIKKGPDRNCPAFNNSGGVSTDLKLNHTDLILLLFLLIPFVPVNSYALNCIDTKFLQEITPGANQPSDISVAPNGDIYLVDGVNSRIVVTGNNGEWKFQFGTEGSGQGQFIHPLGIDISEDGRVFIADSGNHRIQVFDLKGNFKYTFSIAIDSDTHPADPVDIIVSKLKGQLYISDNENHNIKVFEQNGTFKFKWGKFGEESGEFRYPGIMTQNPFNEIFVVDVLNTRAQKFDPFGKYISSIGSWGVSQGKFFRPKGITIDRKNRVFISDSYMGAVQAFTDMGSYIGVLCKNNKKREFNTPVGIYIDENDRLLVVEMRANKITVLKILE